MHAAININLCEGTSCSRRLFHFPFNIKGKSNDALSFNLSTMPGCAGYYGKPIEEWVRQGYSCQECAWENICIESSEKDNQLLSKYNKHLDIDMQMEKIITEK